MTDPDWGPIMKRASAVVTAHGGRTSHAAIVSRELGVPAIVGATGAMRLLRDHDFGVADFSQMLPSGLRSATILGVANSACALT